MRTHKAKTGVAKKPLVVITMRALIQRINRKLDGSMEQLKAPRGRGDLNLGSYYVINQRQNVLIASDVDPESYGRQIGVLKAWETVESRSS